MIAYIKGRVLFKGEDFAVLQTGSLGYKIFLKADELLKVKKGEELAFFVSHIVKEDKSDLYGFASEEEMLFFELLISVSGVGPKSAMAILSLDSIDKLKGAIASADSTYLTRVSGIGAKTAKKMILELQDKIGAGAQKAWVGASEDLLDALKALGYSTREIKNALADMPEHLEKDGEKLKYALSVLSGK